MTRDQLKAVNGSSFSHTNIYKMSLFSLPDKKNHSPFTSSTSQQTYYFKDWQYSILFDSFCMNWDLEQRERYMCFCIKKYLHTDVYTINELVQNYFPLKKENWKYLLKLEWLAIMFSSCVKVHVLSFYCTISCFRNR